MQLQSLRYPASLQLCVLLRLTDNSTVDTFRILYGHFHSCTHAESQYPSYLAALAAVSNVVHDRAHSIASEA
jgi:hypothetical protein